MTLPTLNLLPILPQAILVVAGLSVLLLDAAIRHSSTSKRLLPWIALVALVGAGVAAVWLGMQPGEPMAFQEMVVADGYAMVFSIVVLIAAVLGVLLARDTLPQISDQLGSYYALLLLAVAGMTIMGGALDLMVVFLALEIFSLALYILVGFNRAEPRSAEASLKYFLLGAFASGFFLYGVALVYGSTATTKLAAIGQTLAGQASATGIGGDPLVLYAGIALLIIGFGFKIAIVPFHMWTPDAYQGAPTAVTGFMSAATKAAAFAALVRLFVAAFPASQDVWSWALAILAALTMTLGNLAALRQQSLKRMLAYSSIAHAGYALVGLVPGTSEGASAILFYLFVYAFMNLGAFAVVLMLERLGEDDVLQGELAGLAQRQPALAATMGVFMFSLAGVPPLAGFFAKFFVFSAAMADGWVWLVVIGVVNSVISAFYYLYITVQMYFREPVEPEPMHRIPEPSSRRARARAHATAAGAAGSNGPAGTPAGAAALASSPVALYVGIALAALGTILIGIWPALWADWIAQAVQRVLGS